jgi:hypothetical protein
MTDPTINVKGLIKLGFIDHDNEWRRELVNDCYIYVRMYDEEPRHGGIAFDDFTEISFDSITYKQAKTIIEVFGTRF